MKNTYLNIENSFEKLVAMATAILGNSITFIAACCMVIFWWGNSLFYETDIHQIIGDIIFGVTFLSLFIIQKSFNRFSALLHLKINELVSSHELANNAVMNAADMTEREIKELSLEYVENESVIDEIIEEDYRKTKNNGPICE